MMNVSPFQKPQPEETQQPVVEQFLTTTEACQFLVIGRNGLRELVHSGKLKALRHAGGRAWRFRLKDLEDYISTTMERV